jgi:prephenate dehydrogenase
LLIVTVTHDKQITSTVRRSWWSQWVVMAAHSHCQFMMKVMNLWHFVSYSLIRFYDHMQHTHIAFKGLIDVGILSTISYIYIYATSVYVCVCV